MADLVAALDKPILRGWLEICTPMQISTSGMRQGYSLDAKLASAGESSQFLSISKSKVNKISHVASRKFFSSGKKPLAFYRVVSYCWRSHLYCNWTTWGPVSLQFLKLQTYKSDGSLPQMWNGDIAPRRISTQYWFQNVTHTINYHYTLLLWQGEQLSGWGRSCGHYLPGF